MIERIRSEWEALVERQPSSHLCQGPAYAAVAAQFACAQGGSVHLLTARRDGELRGVWLLAVRRSGLLRVAQPPGDGINEEYAYPLVDPNGRDEAMRAILLAALTLPCDVVRTYNVRPDSGLPELIDREPFASRMGRRQRVKTYSLDFGSFGGWEGYLAQLPPQRLTDVRRKTRRLETLGKIEMGWCETAESAVEAIDWLIEQKREWLSRKGLFSFWLGEDHTRNFYIALARKLDLTVLPLVTYLRLDGRLIAVQLNQPGRQLFESMVVAHDDAYARCSPGEVLTHYGLQLAAERGLQYDYRLMTTTYKERRANVVFEVESGEMVASSLGRQLGPAQAQAGHLALRAGRLIGKLRQANAQDAIGPEFVAAEPSVPADPVARPERSRAPRYGQAHR